MTARVAGLRYEPGARRWMDPRYEVRPLPWGMGVFATAALPAGERLFRFQGPRVAWAEVPAAEIAYAFKDGDAWILPEAPARFVNHGCAPNADVDDDRWLHTLRPIAPGEQIVMDYHAADPAAIAANPEAYFWHDGWTFTCACGDDGCVGRVDGWKRLTAKPEGAP